MQLISLRLGAALLACAALMAVALPNTPTSAQTTDDPTTSAEREDERFRIGRVILNLIPAIGAERERKVGYLRWRFASGAARARRWTC